ncbi:DNA translocase FtsK [Patescibacteria group bacterium]|nr:DNA translocase FtsK [Patescibacteria group bacterium]
MSTRRRRKTYHLKPRQHDDEPTLSIAPETKKGVFIISLLVIAVLSILSIFNLAGNLGVYLKQILGFIFGWGLYLFPIILTVLALILLNPQKYQPKLINYFGLFLSLISFCGLLQLIITFNNIASEFTPGKGGGSIGYALSTPLHRIASPWGALLILLALFIISLLITFNTSLSNLASSLNIFSLIKRKLTSKISEDTVEEEWEETEIEEPESETEEILTEEKKETKELSFFSTKKIPETSNKKIRQIPEGFKVTYASGKSIKVEVPLDLLDNRTSKPTSGDIKANIEKIQKTLKNFGIEVGMGGVNVGPTITQFTLKPAEGVKLSQILALQNDLALSLAAHPLRIEAPIPGKSLVGIEVPNQSIALVRLKEVLVSEEFKRKRGQLLFSLGKDVAGHVWTADLASMPHLLIAGATGSGKSVCINNIIISYLFQHSPQTLRLILIDPKRVEFTTYNGIPHLLTPVITEVDKTINALRWVVNEMDQRYKLFSALSQRNIEAYNASVITNRLPYIIVIIDELADLMATAARDVEGAIVRLAQMARATGIHLVVATQRPSVDIITGLIKANITSRIAFAVASQIDSRTILDTSGADKLLGKGDMLFTSAEVSKPRRLQCAFVSDEEIENVVNFWKEQAEPAYQEEVTEKQVKTSLPGFNNYGEDGDELLEEAKDIILKADKASASLLQRRLRVGYARAARLLDLLEEQGMIGPADGARPREVLLSEEDLAIAKETTNRYQEEDYKENNEEEEEETEEEEEEDDQEIPDKENNY